MSTIAPTTANPEPVSPARRPIRSPVQRLSAGEELLLLGWQVNASQRRLVHLAAQFDEEREWFSLGLKSASHWIASELQIQSSTAREWIRVGHSLRWLPLIDAAWEAQEISYAKVRILTRWADGDNETELLDLALERPADRLTVAIARLFAEGGETDEERDARLHEARSFTSWTDGDGMTVLRIVLPPSVAKPVVAAVDEIVRQVAQTPADGSDDASAEAFGEQVVVVGSGNASAGALGEQSAQTPADDASADAFGQQSVVRLSPNVSGAEHARKTFPATLRELRRRWQPADSGGWCFPSLAQQRADAFVALFLGLGVGLTTEVVVHVRGDGTTFDDGTPTTNQSVLRSLDESFIRLLLHDAERRPVNASSRRRHPTTRQKRVVMETHGHECVDCQSTDLLEVDHNPPYEQTFRTITDELEPRCAPCHRARHRFDRDQGSRRVA